jgi:carbohydrate kinase (thermoresistant glucokinase family)
MQDGGARGMIIVVMGVTGCGKTTVGEKLAAALGIPFHDADNFHPPSNREKLTNDIPLGDVDRVPWLEAMAAQMPEWERAGGAVLACSALKRSYRQVLRSGSPNVAFVYIRGDRRAIARRLEQRARDGHMLIRDFSRILDGQFRDLEEPRDAVVVSNEDSPDEMVREALRLLERRSPPPPRQTGS